MNKLILLLMIFVEGCATTQYIPVPKIKQPHPTIIACPALQKATQDNFVEVIQHNYALYNACRNQTNNIIIPYFEKVK